MPNQDWYDENRTRFEAETTKADLSVPKCLHVGHLIRKTATSVECKACRVGWIDNGTWKLDELN